MPGSPRWLPSCILAGRLPIKPPHVASLCLPHLLFSAPSSILPEHHPVRKCVPRSSRDALERYLAVRLSDRLARSQRASVVPDLYISLHSSFFLFFRRETLGRSPVATSSRRLSQSHNWRTSWWFSELLLSTDHFNSTWSPTEIFKMSPWQIMKRQLPQQQGTLEKHP